MFNVRFLHCSASVLITEIDVQEVKNSATLRPFFYKHCELELYEFIAETLISI